MVDRPCFGAGVLTVGLTLLAASPAAIAEERETIEIVPTVDGLPIGQGAPALETGRTARLGVRIEDAKSAFPLGDLHPAFWMRPATPGREACAAAIDRYLSIGPNAGIEADLNGYLFATLNADGSIGVMDPKLNLATSNLLSLTPREAPVDAWWLDPTGAKLFIASAAAASLEVLDLLSGDLEPVIGDLDGAGSIAVFPDLDRLWVAGSGRVDGIGLAGSEPIRSTGLPHGRWQIEADRQGLRLLALDRDGGRFLILHPESGVIEREIDLGGARGMFVHDSRADAVYILSADGTAIDRLFLDAGAATVHRLPAAAGRLLLIGDGAWLAGLDQGGGDLVLIDTASLRPVHVLRFDGKPDRMKASDDYLYLLERSTGYASLVHLPSLNDRQYPGVLRIPLGVAGGDTLDHSEGVLHGRATPEPIAPLVEGGGAIIASASDKSLYLYMETGMQAPANAFKSWTAPPVAVALLDRQPAEHRAGLYETPYQATAAGLYELVVYLPNPKTTRCFEIAVDGELPEIMAARRPPQLVWSTPDGPMVAGEPIELRFELGGTSADDRRTGEGSAEVMVMAPGRNWHWRGHALPVDGDRFALSLTLPKPGSYQLLVRAPRAPARLHRSAAAHAGRRREEVKVMHSAVPRFAAAMLLALAVFAPQQVRAGDRVTLIDHELVDRTGDKKRFVSEVIGDRKAVIAGIYTGCTTICPITTLIFAELQEALGDRLGEEVRLISLSVDPSNDTPARLAEAADEIGARPGWFWLTGPSALQNEVLLGIGAYSTDVTEHPPVFVVGDGATGEFVQLYGFPSVDEFLDLLAAEGGAS